MLQRNEIAEKGNTRTMIPKAPTIVPAAHAHIGIEDSVSSIDHAVPGIASALSMIAALQLRERKPSAIYAGVQTN